MTTWLIRSNVEPAGRAVGGHEDVELAVLELLDRALALRLRDVARDGGCRVAAGPQLLRERLRLVLGADEHDHALEVLGLEDAREGVDLLRVRHHQVPLRRVRRGGGLVLDRDLLGVLQVLARDAADLRGHRRREQRDLLRLRGVREDRLHVLREAHLEHLVGLVEHEELQLRQVEGALVEVVHDPAGGADDHVHAAAERRQLHAVALAAVDGEHVHAAHAGRVALERLAHLEGELAGGREHEGLRGLLGHVEVGEDRQRERGRLAGAGLRDAEDVAAGEEGGDRGRLDRGGRLVAHVLECLEHLVGETEVAEGRAGGGVRVGGGCGVVSAHASTVGGRGHPGPHGMRIGWRSRRRPLLRRPRQAAGTRSGAGTCPRWRASTAAISMATAAQAVLVATTLSVWIGVSE